MKIIYGVLWAVAILAAALFLKRAQHAHLVSGDVVQRGVEVIIGLSFAVYANFIPKSVPGLKLSPARAARVQAMQRFNSWLFCLAGLVFAAIWAFAPLALAGAASMAVMGGTMVVVLVNLGFCVVSVDRKDLTQAH